MGNLKRHRRASTVGERPPLRIGVVDHAASQAQGQRPYQEDCYVAASPAHYSSLLPNTQALYAIYDGHGGNIASRHASRHLHSALLSSSPFLEGRYEEALLAAFREEDHALKHYMDQHHKKTGGSTAVVAILDLTLGKLAVANVGDSRAVLAVRDAPLAAGQAAPLRAVRLSQDHNPTEPHEHARIQSSGGYVNELGRVGTLNVSRSLGDFSYKVTPENIAHPSGDLLLAVRPGAVVTGDLVSPEPYISTCDVLAPHTPFLVLGSDGIFADQSDQQVVDTVARMRFAQSWDAGAIAQYLTAQAAGHPASDNCTCIVVFFG